MSERRILGSSARQPAAERAPSRWLSQVIVGLALALAAAAPMHAAASDLDALVAELNAVRTQPQRCAGQARAAAPPLQAQRTVAAAAQPDSAAVWAALRRSGYLAARIEVMQISGVNSVAALAALIEQKHCSALMDAELRDLGVARSGSRWTVVFAAPGLDPALGDWRAAGQRVLALVNEARRSPRRCGDERFAAAAPVAWNDALGAAALAHSRDMARSQQFDHRGSDGSDVAQRVQRQGYAWRAVGENIAAGPGSAQQVVAGWLKSPGHCANLMSAEFTQMGAAHVIAPDTPLGIYWTQVFAAPHAAARATQRR